MIVSSSEDNLAAAAKTVAAAGGPAPLADHRRPAKLEGCQQVFNTVKDKFNRCDILVNSAGATKAGNFVDLPDEAWMDGYALKLFGCVRMCRLFWPMLKAAQGHVVNIGGGAARSPGADFSHRRLGQRRDGQFLQGAVAARQAATASTSTSSIPARPRPSGSTNCSSSARKASGKSVDELRKEATAKDGLRRLGKAEDIAALTLFLCSEKARHIQGTAIAVDGGSTVGYY